ncbi:hypothetical protein M422DRAFT_45502 [Sphaerobolus stellatus SS14]|uniref:Uncharacterized protein n=1 Tax=Sphaerobolus stellatus (strain SS14) TaxID=990650 RepID=A0A0C9VJ95_SPHS4|nr:hypothetical protein M422DRAFT_45502 [Sphaerobolus stellatus SS14]
MEILQPILFCSLLQRLVIEYPTTLRFSEGDLRVIGIKLPELRELSLGHLLFHLSPPSLSLSRLLPILNNINPHLEKLGLYLDGNDSITNEKRFFQPHPTLRVLSLDLSPLSPENTDGAAFTLSRLTTMISTSDTPFEIHLELEYSQAYVDIIPAEELRSRNNVAKTWARVEAKLYPLVAARDEKRREMQRVAEYERKGNTPCFIP